MPDSNHHDTLAGRLDAPMVELKLAGDGAETGSFSGYGAVFRNVDSYGDVIAPGAFKASLAEHRAGGTWPPMLLQHGGIALTADDMQPIGVWTELREDDKGLKVAGRLALGTQRGRESYELLKMEPRPALNGLSIGFRAKKWTVGTKPTEPRRTLELVELVEVSLVTLPANTRARVTAVKSDLDLTSIGRFTAWLRGAGGFSRRDADAIAAASWPVVTGHRAPPAANSSEAARAIRALANKL